MASQAWVEMAWGEPHQSGIDHLTAPGRAD